jgi:hypothetical protein
MIAQSKQIDDVLVSVTATEIQTASGRKFWIRELFEPDRVARVKHCMKFLNKPCRIIYGVPENHVISMWPIENDAGTPEATRLPSGNQYTGD